MDVTDKCRWYGKTNSDDVWARSSTLKVQTVGSFQISYLHIDKITWDHIFVREEGNMCWNGKECRANGTSK